MAFYFNQDRCIGCETCVVACKDWHDMPPGPASFRRVHFIERGTFPDVFVAHLSASCFHCAFPACISACPAGAISKRETDGVIIVDGELCLGKDSCDLCLQACPYKAPQFRAEDNARMQLCDFCVDRLAQNKKPTCVDACPMRAIDAGPMEEMRAKYGDIREVEGFVYSEKLAPSIIFKPKEQRPSAALTLG